MRDDFVWSLGNQLLFQKFLFIKQRVGPFGFTKVMGIAAERMMRQRVLRRQSHGHYRVQDGKCRNRELSHSW